MDRIPQKSNPCLFDKEVLKIQKALADSFSWLDHSIGICETLTDIKDGKRFVSANLYKGGGEYEQIMPCEELGNFSFFTLKDAQKVQNSANLVKSPFSLIIWYDMGKVSLPSDERNTEQIKGQILGVLQNLHLSPRIEIEEVYEKAKNVFADYSYDVTANQYMMAPYAGLRIDGNIYASVPCIAQNIIHPYSSLKRLRHYLYKVTFDKLPMDNGSVSLPTGGCSSYVANGKLYRNLDFNYNDTASFIVKTGDFVGMSFVTGLNAGDMDDALIAQLPYRMVDGINKHGIRVSTHIVYNDWGWSGAGTKSVHITRLPFHALMNIRSMATIEDDMRDITANVTTSASMGEYLLMVLVTDGITTYAMLPPTEEGEPYVLQDITSYPKLTNFRWVGGDEVDRADLQTRPTGVERYNLMPCALSDLRFTKAYEDTDRLSEFIGMDGTTKDSSDEELLVIYERAKTAYERRKRDGETWQTVHSVIYGDRGMKELYIQEDWEDNCLIII